MRRKIHAGQTSVTLPIFVFDSTKTDGSGLAGLVFNTSGLVAEYRRQGQATWTAISLVAGTLGTWSSGGFVADGALAGAYEIGLPDAEEASGKWAVVRLYGAANMVPCLNDLELDAIDYQDAVHGGLTALPNAAAGATGGLPTVDGSNGVKVSLGTGTGQMQLTTGGVDLRTIAGFAVSANSGGCTFPLVIPSAAQNATAFWTDTTGSDFTTASSPGKFLMAQLAGAFTGTTSVFTAPALANAPAGTDPWATALPGSYGAGTAGADLYSLFHTGVALTSAGLDAVVIETSLNARQALSIIAAQSAGVLAGATTTSITFAGAGVATNRITATVDTNGNRTAVALSPPA